MTHVINFSAVASGSACSPFDASRSQPFDHSIRSAYDINSWSVLTRLDADGLLIKSRYLLCKTHAKSILNIFPRIWEIVEVQQSVVCFYVVDEFIEIRAIGHRI